MDNNWISVEKKKPKILNGKDYSENVLTWCDGRLHVMCYSFIEAGDASGFAWCNCYGDINGDGEFDDSYYPSHWMPLPKRPRVSLKQDNK